MQRHVGRRPARERLLLAVVLVCSAHLPARAQDLPPTRPFVLGAAATAFSWSLATNASGGTIDTSTGVYTAGPTGGVTDVVQFGDPLGNFATATVTVAPPAWTWGVTVTDPWDTSRVTASLAALSRRVTARVVFDEGQPASGYVPLVRTIRTAADVMGEILDSQYVNTLTVQQYLDRTREYLDALGDTVDVWEVGNEVNGEWLGTTPDVIAKVRGAYDLVSARGKRTALTLYYNEGCFESADHEMFTWVGSNLPADVRAGLDWVLVSYYEDDCNGLQPDWNAVFRQLAVLFPGARLGIGECGTTVAANKEAMLRRYYALRVDEPRFIGGFFWWYFNEDMVPSTKPLWTTLDLLIQRR